MVCIASTHVKAGRHSFMRALAYKGFPLSGLMFIPSHLRIVHVSEDPYVLDRSAWRNLTFACPDADPRRVVDILVLLDMSYTQQVVALDLQQQGLLTNELRRKCDINKNAADTLREGDDIANWQERLSDSEIEKIHLARAFIMNPEVLVLQRPFRHFSEGQGERKRLMEAIRQHITCRGLGMDATTVGRRRPRTVFYTAEQKSEEDAADVIWEINDVDKSISMRLGTASIEAEGKKDGRQPSEAPPEQSRESGPGRQENIAGKPGLLSTTSCFWMPCSKDTENQQINRSQY